MGSSPPTLQDPGTTAGIQGAYNFATGVANNVASQPNQFGPYGSITSQQTGSYTVNTPSGPQTVPTFSQSTQLSPMEQEILGLQQGAGAQAGFGANNLLAGANYGATSPTQAIGNETSGLMGGAENQFQSYEQPFFNTQTEALQSELANQGLTPSDPAYKTAMNNLMQSQGQTTSGFLANMEPQAFSQAQQLYTEPAGLAGQLESMPGAQPQIPGEIQYPQLNVSPPNYEGDVSAYNTAQEQQYQSQNQFMGNVFSGLGQLGLAGAKLFSSGAGAAALLAV